MNHLSIRALEEFPLINPGDNLSSIILDSIEEMILLLMMET